MKCEFHHPTAAFWHSTFNQQGGQDVFRGFKYQRGSGLGNVLSSLFRFILPIAKSTGKMLGKQALKTGGQVVSDMTSGQSLQESLKKRGGDAAVKIGKKLGKRVKKKIQTGRGLGTRGGGKLAIKGGKSTRKPFKRQRRDALGAY